MDKDLSYCDCDACDAGDHATPIGAILVGAATAGVIGLVGGPLGGIVGLIAGAVIGWLVERLIHSGEGEDEG